MALPKTNRELLPHFERWLRKNGVDDGHVTFYRHVFTELSTNLDELVVDADVDVLEEFLDRKIEAGLSPARQKAYRQVLEDILAFRDAFRTEVGRKATPPPRQRFNIYAAGALDGANGDMPGELTRTLNEAPLLDAEERMSDLDEQQGNQSFFSVRPKKKKGPRSPLESRSTRSNAATPIPEHWSEIRGELLNKTDSDATPIPDFSDVGSAGLFDPDSSMPPIPDGIERPPSVTEFFSKSAPMERPPSVTDLFSRKLERPPSVNELLTGSATRNKPLKPEDLFNDALAAVDSPLSQVDGDTTAPPPGFGTRRSPPKRANTAVPADATPDIFSGGGPQRGPADQDKTPIPGQIDGLLSNASDPNESGFPGFRDRRGKRDVMRPETRAGRPGSRSEHGTVPAQQEPLEFFGPPLELESDAIEVVPPSPAHEIEQDFAFSKLPLMDGSADDAIAVADDDEIEPSQGAKRGPSLRAVDVPTRRSGRARPVSSDTHTRAEIDEIKARVEKKIESAAADSGRRPARRVMFTYDGRIDIDQAPPKGSEFDPVAPSAGAAKGALRVASPYLGMTLLVLGLGGVALASGLDIISIPSLSGDSGLIVGAFGVIIGIALLLATFRVFQLAAEPIRNNTPVAVLTAYHEAMWRQNWRAAYGCLARHQDDFGARPRYTVDNERALGTDFNHLNLKEFVRYWKEHHPSHKVSAAERARGRATPPEIEDMRQVAGSVSGGGVLLLVELGDELHYIVPVVQLGHAWYVADGQLLPRANKSG